MRDGWELKKLSDIFYIKPPKSEVRERLDTEDEVSFLPMEDLGAHARHVEATKIKKLKDVIAGYTYFANGDVLLAKITPCFENGKVGVARNLVNGVGFGSSEYIVFRSTGEVIPDYLFYFLTNETFREEGRSKMTGAVGHKRVPMDFIDNYRLPFPKDHHEQKRIIDILDESFTVIDKAKTNIERNLQNAKDFLESYLQAVFTKASKDSKMVPLGEVCYTSGRIGWKGLTSKEYTKEGPLFLSVHSLNYGDYADSRDAFHISQARYDESPKIILREGDVLICKDGAGIGKLGMVGKLSEQVTINSSLLLIRPNNSLSTKYLYFNLLSASFQKLVKSRLQGATTPHLYQRDIVTFPIMLPSKNKQEEIAYKLEQVSKTVRDISMVYHQKLSYLYELKKSVLQKAFNGDLIGTAKTLIA
jgi:type I restriction enzyme S subunit